MAFNPDDPHDGHASDELGFTYRMVHVGPELVSAVLADITGRRAGLPLFTDPVLSDPVPACELRALHRALLGGAAALRRDESAHRRDFVDRARQPPPTGGHRRPADAAAVSPGVPAVAGGSGS